MGPVTLRYPAAQSMCSFVLIARSGVKDVDAFKASRADVVIALSSVITLLKKTHTCTATEMCSTVNTEVCGLSNWCCEQLYSSL